MLLEDCASQLQHLKTGAWTGRQSFVGDKLLQIKMTPSVPEEYFRLLWTIHYTIKNDAVRHVKLQAGELQFFNLKCFQSVDKLSNAVELKGTFEPFVASTSDLLC